MFCYILHTIYLYTWLPNLHLLTEVVEVGCFNDDLTDHALPFMKLKSDSMTWSLCASTCRQASFNYAGIQEGRYCYCGQSGYDKYGPSTCTMTCTGNSNQICGDHTKITVLPACQPGFYGTSCEKNCEPNCYQCDVETGKCIIPKAVTTAPTPVTPVTRPPTGCFMCCSVSLFICTWWNIIGVFTIVVY